MLSVKVLGPGCRSCLELEKNAREAITLLGEEVSLEKVAEVSRIASYGVIETPTLVVNEKVVASGRVPEPSEIVSFLATAMSEGEGR